MAAVSDTIAATVTLKADGAIKDLGALSRKAKETGTAFNAAGKSSAAAGAKIGDGANKGAQGVNNLNRNSLSVSKTLGAMGGVTGRVAANFGSLGGAGAGIVALGVGLHSVLSAQSSLNEATNASKITFREAAGEVERFAEGANRIGLSKRAALEAAAGFGTLLTGLGYGRKEAAAFSVSLTGLSADLASTFGGSVEDASNALRAMFRGELDPIEKYGVKVNEAATSQRALQLGLAGSKGELSEQDKTLARLTLAYTQTTAAQGDFNRTLADTANQQRIAAATSENLRASLGAAVAPGYTQALQGINAGLGALDSVAKKNGTSIGDVTKKVLGYTTVLGFLGSRQKDSAQNFKGQEDALKTFAQELQGGRTDSEAYRGAVEYLKKANADAERTQKALNEAIGGQAAEMTKARTETQASLGSIQSLVSAQRGAQDATIRVTDARTSLADAERSLSDLRAKGAVDARAVADAERQVADAAQTTRDARERLGDAEKKLGDLRRKGPVDAERVADAERSIADASRGVADARKAVADAEREVAKLRAGPTGDEKKDAARAILRAQLELEQAQARQLEAQQAVNDSRGADTIGATLGLRNADLALAEAVDAVAAALKAQQDLNARGLAGSEAMVEATSRVEDARQREADAVLRQTEAEAAARLARAGDPEFAGNVARAERDVEQARRGVEAAVRGEHEASAALRQASAGDPNFARDLAKANDAVTKAKMDLRRAEFDLHPARIAANLAQQEFNEKVSGADGPARNLIGLANSLGIQYNFVGDAARYAASWIHAATVNQNANTAARIGAHANLGGIMGGIAIAGTRAAGGPVTAGNAYVVGEKRAELFVPDSNGVILPRVPSGVGASSQTIVVPVILDGREVARVVTNHQNASSRQGGPVAGRRR